MNFRSIFIVAISLLSVLATVSVFSPYLGIIPVHAQGTLVASPNPLTVEIGSNTFTSTITVSGFTGAVTLAAVASTTNPPSGSVVFSLDSSTVTGSGTVHLLVSDPDFTTPFPPGGDINVTATPTGSAVPTEFIIVGLTLTIPANRAQIVLECQGLIPATPNCSSTSILPFESIVYDGNNNGIFDAGDQIIVGRLPPVGTHLANDAKLQWRDVNNLCTSVANCHWAGTPGIDPVFYNTNATVAGRVFLFGPMTTLTTNIHGTTGTCTVASTCADLKLRFAQTDQCGTVACATLQGVVEVKAKLVNVGGILADGSEQDVLAQQIIYSFNPGVLQALCSATPCGSTLSGQFDQFCALQSSATGGGVCGSPLTGRFTFVVDSYCTNSGGSVLDTISVDNDNGKISSSSLCSQGPPANNDTGIGCDPNYTDTSRIGTCPGDITKGPAGVPNPPLSNVTSTIVEFIVGIGSTPITNVASAPGVSGSSLGDIDGTLSSNVPVILVSSSFNNGATHSTTTSVSCLPASVAVNTTTTCTATVTDPATSGIVTPTGTVTFAITTGTGSFNVPTCTLAAGTYAAGTTTPSTSCSVIYKPSQIGTGSHTLRATFGGDSSHTTSTNTAVVTVTPPAAAPTSTAVNCVSASVTVNTGSVCTATVTDTSASPTTPTGSVSFASDGTGTFSLPGASCSLSAGAVAGTASCQVTYTPTVVGTGTHTITGTFVPTSNHAASHGMFALTVTPPAAHPTSTSVNCVPASVTVNTPTVCTATITDTSATGATTPTGSVSFTSDGTGTFTPAASCSLSAGTTAGTATCQVTYTPSVVGTGSHTINGTYAPASNHLASHGTFALTVTAPVAHPTSTAVNCVPASVIVNTGTVCTATITDTSTTGATTPTGTVGFTSDGTGTFTLPGTSCSLSAGTVAGTASCQVTYTPTVVGTGTHTVTGTYAPTSNHAASHGTFAVTVTPPPAHPTTTGVNCVPASVTVNSGSLCTATVTDTSTSGATTPTGSVSFASDGTGSFTPATICNLSAGTTAGTATCEVTYTPTVVGTGTHTITGTFVPTSNHAASNGAFALTVSPPAAHPTSTAVDCAPASVTVSTVTLCTATVTDTSTSGATTPTGSVGFTSDGTGSFTPATSCSLSAGTTAGTATCQVIYTPTVAGTGTHTITGTFVPTSNHAASHGTFALTVTPPTAAPTTTGVSCVPSSVTVNTGSVCTATVTDTSTTGATTPTGPVGFTSDGTGTFTPGTSCNLLAGTVAGTATCQVTYTPTVVGTGTHTITGTYAPTSNHAASDGSFALTVTAPAAHPTSTAVNCVPASVTVSTGTVCTATVTDTSATGATTPTGSVGFTSDGTGTFTLPGTSCSLSAGIVAGTSSCHVTYTPTVVGTGTHTITGTYAPTSNHAASHGSFALTVTLPAAAPTSTVVTCVPASVTLNSGSVCTATVTDTSASPTTPTGSVGFTTDGTGTFTPGTSCSLSAGTVAGTASCQVTYTPTVVGTGTHSITGTYAPTSNHAASDGSFALTVTAPAAHPTSTGVNCVPASVTVSTGTVCTATVTDTSATGATTPTGSVGFTSDGTGMFTPSTSCNLSAGTTASTATCQVTYTPTVVGTGTHTITGTYSPTSNHAASHGTFALTVTPPAAAPTTTGVSCVPSSVTINTGTLCTAVVTDTSASHTTPTGSVSFTSDGTGSFTPATSCSLSAVGAPGAATCQVTYTPTAVGTGTHTITGTYVPTSNHAASHGTFALTVTPPAVHPTSTSVNCVPTSVTVNTGTVCTATVTDSSAEGATTPTGTVGFASDSTGSFTPSTSCSLSAGTVAGTSTCQVTYTPTAVGTGTHTITGTYSPTSNHLASSGQFVLTVTSAGAKPVLLTFSGFDLDDFDNGVGQFQVLVNGHQVVDIPAGLNHLSGTGDYLPYEKTWVKFGPFDITSFVVQGQNTIVFKDPLSSHFGLVRNVTITQGTTILLQVRGAGLVFPGHSTTYTFSNPPLFITGFTASPSSASVEQNVTFTATYTGGTAPFRCIFRFGDGEYAIVQGASGSCSVTHDYDCSGSFSASVTVRGASTSDNVSARLTVIVSDN